MQAYAAADNYAGRWEIAQSPYAVDIDTAFFEVADNTGQLKTTQRVDFESGKTDFEIILIIITQVIRRNIRIFFT